MTTSEDEGRKKIEDGVEDFFITLLLCLVTFKLCDSIIYSKS